MNAPARPWLTDRARKKLTLPGLLALVPWMGIVLYWMLDYSGPYRWLSEWQMRMVGGYMPWISATVPMMLGWGATTFALQQMLPPRRSPAGAGEALRGAIDGVLRFLGSIPGAAAIFVLFAGLALHIHNEAASYGALRRVTPAEMASPRAHRWVEVTGWPDERMVSQSENEGEEILYFGLRSVPAAGDGELVPVFVTARQSELAETMRRNGDGSVTIRGIARHSMDAPVRRYLQAQGVTLAEKPWVLHPLQTPEQQAGAAPWMLAVGAAVSVGVWLRFRGS